MRAFAAALLLTGCVVGGGAASAKSLDGTEWVLTTLRGLPVTAAPITLSFDKKGVSGSGGCNQYQARYDSSGSKLTFGMMSLTKRACRPPLVNEQEKTYIGVLAKTSAFKTRGRRLTLLDDAGVPLAQFERRARGKAAAKP